MSLVPVFDGHNDVLARLHLHGDGAVDTFWKGRQSGHIDATKAREGGFVGGLFALWVPNKPRKSSSSLAESMRQRQYSIALSDKLDAEYAQDIVWNEIGLLRELSMTGPFSICRNVAEIEEANAAGAIAAVMHLEGAESIDTDLFELDALYDAGLRSIGPVWSRPTLFGEGVPFRFPSSPDIGLGLTDAGIRLVKRCNELSILLDVAHLNEAGFWDVAKYSTSPIVATHSNAHAISQHSRNLTDKQLDAIAETGGLVGINFATSFLREDGRMISDTPRELILRQADYLIDRLGEDCVAFGSDFDGAIIPRNLGSAAGMQGVVEDMRQHGYDEPLIAKLCKGNWMRVLREIWGG